MIAAINLVYTLRTLHFRNKKCERFNAEKNMYQMI